MKTKTALLNVNVVLEFFNLIIWLFTFYLFIILSCYLLFYHKLYSTAGFLEAWAI